MLANENYCFTNILQFARPPHLRLKKITMSFRYRTMTSESSCTHIHSDGNNSNHGHIMERNVESDRPVSMRFPSRNYILYKLNIFNIIVHVRMTNERTRLVCVKCQEQQFTDVRGRRQITCAIFIFHLCWIKNIYIIHDIIFVLNVWRGRMLIGSDFRRNINVLRQS